MSIKKIIASLAFTTASALCFSAAANAALPGFYVGGQVGYADTHYSTGDISNVTSASITNTGVAGRVFGGYEFTPNWAGELGYTQFSNTKFNNVNGTGVNSHISQYAVDLAGKGILPLDNGFALYGKLGGAYVKANGNNGIGTTTKINPEVGAGASYDLTPNVPVDISWTHIQKVGGNIPNTDFFAAGIGYNFG